MPAGGGRRLRRRPHAAALLALLLLLLTAVAAASPSVSAAHQTCPVDAPWWHSSSTSSIHSNSSTCPARTAAGVVAPQAPAAASTARVNDTAAAGGTSSSSGGADGADVQGSCSISRSGSSGQQSGDDESASGQVYIVRFSEYRMLPDLKGLLTQALSSVQQHWAWVDRDNAAVRAHPTDFALLSVEPGQLAALQQLLLAANSKVGLGFRDCHPDRRIRGSSSWQPEGPLAAAFSDGQLQQQQGQQGQQGHPAALRQPPGALRLAQELQAMPSKQLLADAPTTEGRGGSTGSHQQQQPQQGQSTTQQPQQEEQQPVQPPAPQEGDSIWSVSKPPGRMSTSHTIGLNPNSQADRQAGYNKDELRRRSSSRRRGLLGWAADLLLGGAAGAGDDEDNRQQQQQQRRLFGRRLEQADTRVTSLLEAPVLWKQGFSGKGIRVGVFDTGIREGHPHIRNIRERTNWTHQNSLADGLGHGSFVAGVIGSQDSTCPGFAPDMELYTFKVFTDDQVSYTSWFLDAFNHAIACKLTIINLSIGGPDFMDQPFVDKVLEVTSNGVIMISAIGNDGPLYGTLNNPADQPDVIGVGGIDNDNRIAAFSSRGMTTWELPSGTGRIKPDVMAYGKDVSGSKITTGCRSLSGTSVASPVVAGAASLLASTLPEERRWLLNPGSLKQALVEGAVRLPDLNMYEQGSGRINLPASAAILATYSPRASVIPPALDLTDCPYSWPYCSQPLYAFGLPVAFNATIVNGMAVTGQLVGSPVFTPTDEGGRLLHVTFQHSEVVWPWSGYLALFIEVSPGAWNYTGVASGNVTFHVQSPPQYGTKSVQTSVVVLPLKVRIIPTPPRSKRLLWDVLHSIKYPPGYVPRDNLDIKSDVLDWHGDHPFTNYHDTLNALRGAGYFVEILSSPSTCFHPDNYGAYLVMDSEEEWYTEEVAALATAVKEHGMALIVFAEWYHLQSLKQMKFFDDNTRSWWTPITGGANVPALNELLAPHNITLGERILTGTADLGKHKVTVLYGANIAKFPAGGFLHVTNINDASGKSNPTPGDWAPFGVTASGKGHVAVLGDSNCLDSSHMVSPCHDFVKDLLAALLDGSSTGSSSSSSLMAPSKQLKEPYTAPGFSEPPQRRADVNFTRYSWVLQHPLACYASSPCQYRTPSDCPAGDKAWEHKTLVAGKEPPNALLQPPQQQKQPAEAAAPAKKTDTAPAAAAPAAAKKDDAVELDDAAAAATEREEAAEREAEQDEVAAREAEAAAAAATAAATAAAAQQQQAPPATEAVRTVQTDADNNPPATTPEKQQQQAPPASMDLQDSASGQAEAAQQQQQRAFVSQAASWGTLICIGGLLGVVVLWQMRAPSSGGAPGRRWGRYTAVRRPPSPERGLPADRSISMV